MNILENIEFSAEKANIFKIKNSPKSRQFVVALGEGAVMKKHQTPVPATLIVLKGEINFLIEGQELRFGEADVYEIPVNVQHEVVGIQEKNLFLIVQEL